MNYSTFIPNSIFQSVVECYWTVDGFDTAWQKITPDGCPEIILHLKDPYRIRHDDGTVEIQPLAIAAGQLDRCIYVQPTGESDVVGIKLKPNGMWKLTGYPMNTLCNQVVDLNRVWNNSGDELLRSLKEIDDAPARISAIENLLGKALPFPEQDILPDVIIREVRDNRGQVTMAELAERAGCTIRQIERLFRDQVGMSVKTFCRVIRFNAVFKLLQQNSLTRAEASYVAGYFDQAHFNKEFRQFTGENPKAYFMNNHRFSNFFLSR